MLLEYAEINFWSCVLHEIYLGFQLSLVFQKESAYSVAYGQCYKCNNFEQMLRFEHLYNKTGLLNCWSNIPWFNYSCQSYTSLYFGKRVGICWQLTRRRFYQAYTVYQYFIFLIFSTIQGVFFFFFLSNSCSESSV